MTSRIAIYGGTFDPIHNGHLGSITELAQRLNIDQVKLIPSYIPPHRDEPGATSAQRLEMVRLGAAALPKVQVDDREVQRQGRSYTVETLEQLRSELGPEAVLFFILGSDAYALLHEWHRWQELTNYAHMVVMQRPESNGREPEPAVLTWQQSRFVPEPLEISGVCGAITKITLTQYDIAATEIRRRVRCGESIDVLVPQAVASYITEHKLYLSPTRLS